MSEAEPTTPAPRRLARVHATAMVMAALLAVWAAVVATLQPIQGLAFTVWDRTTWNGRILHAGYDVSLSNDLIGERPFTDWQAYSVEWRGKVATSEAGRHTFALIADDGAVLEIDDQVVVDNGGRHASQRALGTLDLRPGLHEFRLRYVQDGGRHDLDLRWSRDGESFAPIPADRLVPPDVSPAAYPWRGLAPVVVATAVALAAWALLAPLRRRLAGTLAAPFWQRTADALQRPGPAMACIVAIGLPLRLLLLLTSPAVLWPDSTVFHLTSRDILRGAWASHDAYRTAVYPFLMTAVTGGRDSEALGLVLVGLQQLSGIGAALLFYLAGRRAFTPRVALAGAAVFAAHPLQLFYEISILTEAIFTLGLAGTLWAAIRCHERPGVAAGALLGLLAALLVLIRPVAQWYLPALLLVLAAASPRRSAIWRPAVVAVACYAVPMSGWMAVNQQEFGFYGVALGRGMGLYTRVFEIDRLSPPSPGPDPEMRALWVRAGIERWSPNRVRDELNYRRRLSSVAADERMYAFARDAAFARLPAFTAGTVAQLTRLIAAPRESIRRCDSPVGPYLCSGRSTGESLPSFPNAPDARSRWRTVAVNYVSRVRWPMVPIGVLAVAGAAAVLAEGATLVPGLLVAATIACMTLVPAVSQYPHDRFRLPIDALLFMLAAACLRRAAAAHGAGEDGRSQ